MIRKVFLSFMFCSMITNAYAQELGGARPPEFQSTTVSEDRKVTFRIFAPQASKVALSSSDIPGIPQQGLALLKGESGIWEGTTPSVPGGAYRYHFLVDGISVIDPKNPTTSESNANTWSMVAVEGTGYSDLKNVPHGTIGIVSYFSKSLDRTRRMHVYTPPEYESGSDSYPVFYLLHGAFDSDASWSSVGQVGRIMDNLIAEGKAKPMIVVMPMGHTAFFSFGPGGNFEKQMEEFDTDFRSTVRPMVESRYRVKLDRTSRAIAGLSMGGAQALNIAFADLKDYAYVGVFSSGVFGMDRSGPDSGPGQAWVNKYQVALNDVELQKGLKLIWFATGKDDFLLATSRSTVSAIQKFGFDVTYEETQGGHTWLVWREYLSTFAPKLFQ